MRLPVEFEKKQEEQEIKAYSVNHLPIVKEFAAKLGIVEVINTLVPSRMHVEPGVIFLGMILDTLSELSRILNPRGICGIILLMAVW